jgi:hypothetical protein
VRNQNMVSEHLSQLAMTHTIRTEHDPITKQLTHGERDMITNNNRTKDLNDVGVIFHAITLFAEANGERLDRSIVSFGYDCLLLRAELAATELAAQHVDDGDDWDGCVWLDRLLDISQGSLAEALFTDDADVRSIVHQWLSKFA